MEVLSQIKEYICNFYDSLLCWDTQVLENGSSGLLK